MPEWTKDEPGLKGALDELKRLKRRALARPLRPLLLALLGTALMVGMRARAGHSYISRVIYRVTEADLDASTAPRTAPRLRSYVLDVAFSNARLIELMKSHKLYVNSLKRDPSLALESMREDIGVEIWRNYFLEGDESNRSARLAISYESFDADIAHRVARDLGRLIELEEWESRRAQADEAARLSRAGAEASREELIHRRGQIVAKEVALLTARPPDDALLRIEIANLERSIPAMEGRLKMQDSRKNALSLRASAEQQRLGLQFELVDPGDVARFRISKPRELTVVGIVVFCILLPLCGIFTASFDPRIYEAEDIRRLGLTAIGQVQRFPGDEVGALDARLAREHNRGSKS